MVRRSLLALGLAALSATGAIAQLTVGRLYSAGYVIIPTAFPPHSALEIMHPAAGAGNLTRAVVRWAVGPGTPCPNAYMLKFVRPSGPFGTYLTFAERGPFPGANGSNEVALSPPVGVSPGDMIAITQLVAPTTCGGFVSTLTPEAVSLEVNSEAIGGLTVVNGLAPAIFASSDAASVVAILAAAGATAGNNGSFFRTAVQITNTDSAPLGGTLLYHPQGVIGKASDPAMPFTVLPQQTLSIPDIATALGQTGLGSIDVLTSGMTPIISARIFNDGGASGTSGFTEEALSPYEALGSDGYLQIPADVANFRMNVGIRTLHEGVALSVVCTTADGAAVGQTLRKTYMPNFYEQTSAQSFAGLSELPPGGTIKITVLAGKAIVYGTTTDNRTNDSNMQFALSTR